MTYLSSPLAYPSSSSPPEDVLSRKRPNEEPHLPGKKRLFGKDFVFPTAHGQKHRAGPLKEISNVPAPAIEPTHTNNPFLDEEDESSKTLADVDLENEIAKDSEGPATLIDTSIGSPASFTSCLSSSGKRRVLYQKTKGQSLSYERLVAQRSTTEPGKATKSYYGINIHDILKEAKESEKQHREIEDAQPQQEATVLPSIEAPRGKKRQKHALWTEKYRARKFTELVGDERTHRSVLRWLKAWDSVVFPGAAKPRVKKGIEDQEEHAHRKVLLLTGPPGLGKTTLAHVCARQAGYEAVEINASDERSREVVRGKIRDCVGTENVRGLNSIENERTVRKAGRPVCVVVDEVDGVVTGSSGGGEGGFIKALIDLILLDQKNARKVGADTTNPKRKKGDKFRLLRPMILICNDVYHPSLRPLRSSNLAEIVHVRKPPIEKIITRMKNVFEKEGIAAETDGVRRLCEATWGISSRKEGRASSNTGDGDIRGVLVVGEWVACRLRSSNKSNSPRLTRQWIEKHVISDLSTGGTGARGMGRGGLKETVDRVFLEGAGFPKTLSTISIDDAIPIASTEKNEAPSSVLEIARGNAISLLRNAVDTCGEHDRIVSDLYTAYPSRTFQDDTFLSKPTTAYEWLDFHDTVSSRVFSNQDWELSPYLSQAPLGFHYLFASSAKSGSWGGPNENSNFTSGKDNEDDQLPFTGPRADFAYHEAYKANHASLQALHSSLSIPLHRSFRSAEEVATDLLPHLNRMLNPDVKPVVMGGSNEQRGTATVRRESERKMVKRAVHAMAATNVTFERTKVEDDSIRGGYRGWVYRMEPPIDTLSTFATASDSKTSTSAQPTRYAVRQVLDQESVRFRAQQAAEARRARHGGLGDMPHTDDSHQLSASTNPTDATAPNTVVSFKPKRDFFGRVIATAEDTQEGSNNRGRSGSTVGQPKGAEPGSNKGRIWVSYHEGFSNAVRKPISLRELMEGL